MDLETVGYLAVSDHQRVAARVNRRGWISDVGRWSVAARPRWQVIIGVFSTVVGSPRAWGSLGNPIRPLHPLNRAVLRR